MNTRGYVLKSGLFMLPAVIRCSHCGGAFTVLAGKLASSPITCGLCDARLELTRGERLELWAEHLRRAGQSLSTEKRQSKARIPPES